AAAVPGVLLLDDADAALARGDVDAVAVVTSAGARPPLVRRALAAGLAVLAEKPLAATVAEEQALLAEIERSGQAVTVNLFNRSTDYHRSLVERVGAGELGRLLSVDVAHLTPDLLPGEGHASEGPPFHDCGLHYVDLARWYAGSEYADWHAVGLRVWDWPDPWWVDVHGHFTDGTLVHLSQTFAYAQAAAVVTARNAVEVVGTHGVLRLEHDFRVVTVRGTTRRGTTEETWPYRGKALDVLAGDLADALDGRPPPAMPTARDAVLASATSQQMLDQATAGAPPVGTRADLERTRAHRAALADRGAAFPEGVLRPQHPS
ncbi:Gfo/Idh/MocA family protein, partial [Desertihabitans aurantiacus]|uniref:Gfo/Idh/MocA family protein n=1 Tax=Desertihabitans aurantiacus TaxID=2282477 RepID=UPI000DF8632F